MAANGQLVFTDVDKVTFKGVGNTSNAVIDTTTGKIGVGVDSPDANLHVLGNCFVSTNFELGGTMSMGTVTVRAQHELSAITATGNTTPHTVEFQNAETGFVTTSNVGIGTSTPLETLDVYGGFLVRPERTTTTYSNTWNRSDGDFYYNTTPQFGSVLDVIYSKNAIYTTTSGLKVSPPSNDSEFYYIMQHDAFNPGLYFPLPRAITSPYLSGDVFSSTRFKADNTEDFTGFAIGQDYQGGNQLNDFSQDLDIAKAHSAHMYFKTASPDGSLTEKMRITNTGNVGIGTTSPLRKLDVSTTGSIGFGNNVNGVDERGLYWHNATDYAIYRTAGSWSSPNYQQLKLHWGTGIVLEAGNGTYGRSYVGVNDRMSIGSSYYNSNTKPPGDGLLVEGNVGIGTMTPSSIFNTYGGALWDGTDHTSKVCATLQVGRGGGSGAPTYDSGTGAILEFRHDSDSRFVTVESVSEAQYSVDIGLRFKTVTDGTGPQERMRITHTGNVGVGLTNPGTINSVPSTSVDHHVVGRYIVSEPNDDEHWSISTNNDFDIKRSINGGGYIAAAKITFNTGAYVDLITFTGQHRSSHIENVTPRMASEYEGLIVCANRDNYESVNGDKKRGNSAITINEAVPLLNLSSSAMDKTCFGVISNSEDPNNRIQKFGNFSSHHFKMKGDEHIFINSIGEGGIWVVNTNGSLESGDYITTSNIHGYGMKQDDQFLANYTVAKITMNCNFDPQDLPIQYIVQQEKTVTKYLDIKNNIVSTEEESHSSYETNELVNVLDEHGQIQWEDDPSGATEKAYKIRYLDADGNITDEANHVHKAAFVGCTYHCG